MKNILILAFFFLFISGAFAQAGNPSYGPVPYRELKETIGDTYILLPRDYLTIKHGYDEIYKASDASQIKLTSDYEGKKIKLTSIDANKNAHFVDSDGVEYIAEIIKRSYLDITPLSDIENARKILLGKTLWVNNAGYMVKGDFRDDSKQTKIPLTRFQPLTVVSVQPGTINTFPELIYLKNTKGEIGYINVSVSGTNTDLEPKYLFANFLLTEDPKVKYHFTPTVWKMVIAGYTEIGMPLEAFILVEGTPTRMNTTKTAKGTSLQLVYGTDNPRYFYFEGGKLTATQH